MHLSLLAGARAERSEVWGASGRYWLRARAERSEVRGASGRYWRYDTR
ncbi:hypothetical protein GCM10027403_29030 [Arthrobacter tecti]